MAARFSPSKLEKVVKLVAQATGAAKVLIRPDGTIEVLPVDKAAPPPIDRPRPTRL